MDNRGKKSETSNFEKKLNDHIENEKKLQEELDTLKSERDKKVLDYQKNLEKERDLFKQKILDSENKFKESEQKRSGMMFEVEKERAKWALEKDHLMSQKNEATENSERLEKRKEALTRENERLKNELRNRMRYQQNAAATG